MSEEEPREAHSLPADDRDRTAEDRDQRAEAHDQESAARDERSAARDERAEARERAVEEVDTGAAGDRAGALRDRRGGASDRIQAADDREAASTDRALSAQDRAASSIDVLTRAHRRDAGMLELEREIARVKRTGESIALAFVDVDRLKRTNDSLGHAAGDRLLREAAYSIRAHLRSYDLIIRYGGDEFLCALVGATREEAAERFSLVNADLRATREASITVGYSEFKAGDAIEDIIARADEAMYRERQQEPSAPRPGRNTPVMAGSTTEIREALGEMRYACEQLSDRPERQREAERHALRLEQLLRHGETHKGNPNLSANGIVMRARAFLIDFKDHGFIHDDTPPDDV